MARPVNLLDVNVLIALVSTQHVHHGAAHQWFSGVELWATTPITETALVRLSANPAVAGGELPMPDAISLLRRLRELPTHVFMEDRASLADPVIDLTALVGYRQVTDFHLVNLAATAGATLATFDSRLQAALAPADRRHVVVVPV